MSDLQTSFTKAKRRVAELEDLLKMNQGSFAQMSTVNAELKAELQQRFTEQQVKEEKMRRIISEMKREAAGLKELVGVKDR